jgi:dolichol-phosphate mannosyltransferase
MAVDVSIISPVHNEEANLSYLYNRLARAWPARYSWELILVDDGSTDKSVVKMRELCRVHANVRVISFSKNYGHQIALSAGYDHAEGRAVITMDADLQHPPESVPDLLRLWEEGNDIVFAIREDDHDLSWFKRTSSRGFYSLLKMISRVDLVHGAADFRLLDRRVVLYLRQYRERDRFLRGIISDMGFRRAVCRYKEAARERGVSKYDLVRMMRLALSGVLSFSSFPLKLCSSLGMLVSFCRFAYAGWIIYVKLMYGASAGMASILVGVFFIGGVQLIFIGVLGEYLASVLKEVKVRPLYCVAERINCPEVPFSPVRGGKDNDAGE